MIGLAWQTTTRRASGVRAPTTPSQNTMISAQPVPHRQAAPQPVAPPPASSTATATPASAPPQPKPDRKPWPTMTPALKAALKRRAADVQHAREQLTQCGDVKVPWLREQCTEQWKRELREREEEYESLVPKSGP